MRRFNTYEVYIFDCDGVILDSNSSKIDAMTEALKANTFVESGITEAIEYFRLNFGKSRYHHVDVFINKYLSLSTKNIELFKRQLLDEYDRQVELKYAKAPVINCLEGTLKKLGGQIYVVSGTEQTQLRRVLLNKGLNKYFKGIFGSPESKENLIKDILAVEGTRDAIMIGDSIADLNAANAMSIDFLGLLDKSNVPDSLMASCEKNGYQYLANWECIDV